MDKPETPTRSGFSADKGTLLFRTAYKKTGRQVRVHVLLEHVVDGDLLALSAFLPQSRRQSGVRRLFGLFLSIVVP